MQLLLAQGIGANGMYAGDALFLPTARRMLQQAELLADFVVVDSPPLLAVIDALELARAADAVLIVARLGSTDLRRLTALGALLDGAHIVPVGLALIGADVPGGRESYDYKYRSNDGEVMLGRSADSARSHNSSAVLADAPRAEVGRVRDRT